ncbi:MAG: hypothetical protein QW303_04710 [Nitrososphaerota archaeon]
MFAECLFEKYSEINKVKKNEINKKILNYIYEFQEIIKIFCNRLLNIIQKIYKLKIFLLQNNLFEDIIDSYNHLVCNYNVIIYKLRNKKVYKKYYIIYNSVNGGKDLCNHLLSIVINLVVSFQIPEIITSLDRLYISHGIIEFNKNILIKNNKLQIKVIYFFKKAKPKRLHYRGIVYFYPSISIVVYSIAICRKINPQINP